jgi:hypothetical protein
MTKAEIVLTAWDKTLETRDFSHLSVFWCILGEIRIKNFKIIRENEDYIVATHDVVQDGKPRSNVMVYAEKANGKFIYWKIQRAFEM